MLPTVMVSLNSPLPLTDLQNLLYVSLVATMLFSTGELLPLLVYGMPLLSLCSYVTLNTIGMLHLAYIALCTVLIGWGEHEQAPYLCVDRV